MTFADVTEAVEPDSVVLRDPTGRHQLQVIEQNYRAEPVSQQLLLSLFEGQTIDFKVRQGERDEIVKGKIIRSGYVDRAGLIRRFGPNNQYLYNQYLYSTNTQNPPGLEQPLIEVDGKLQFSLPGTPLFPRLPDNTILKPVMNWKLQSDGGSFNAELGYLTSGLSWQAAYNVNAPVKGDVLELVGWVTIDNHSGKEFQNANVKLMAGDISKLQPNQAGGVGGGLQTFAALSSGGPTWPPQVTQKTFDEYHLYSLNNPVTFHNAEVKQVEFLRASGIQAKRVYVYDGFHLDLTRYQGYNWEYLRQTRDFGGDSNKNVWVMEEFKNSEANRLGMPSPRGKMRFYRRDEGGQLEFIGENTIEHTPKDETLRIYTGNAFDLVGERVRTNFSIDNARSFADESFEIHLRNHKSEPANITVVEHLYRAATWEITHNSADFKKKDSQTIEFAVNVPAQGEQKITYAVHYNW